MRKLEITLSLVLIGFVTLVTFVAFHTYKDMRESNQMLRQQSKETRPDDVLTHIKTELHLRETLEGAGVAVIEANREHRIVGWDNVAASLWGYTKQEALQMHVEDLMDEELTFDHVARYNQGVARNTGIGHILSCDAARHRDGHFFSVMLNIRAKNGRVVALAQEPVMLK